MAPDPNWPASVALLHREEMVYIRRLIVEILGHELEAELHPFLQSILEWACLRTSKTGIRGFRIKSIAQLPVVIPSDANEAPAPTNRQLRSAVQRGEPVEFHVLATVDSASARFTNSTASMPARRARDPLRTPDYTTYLTPRDPRKAHQRLMFVHELKRYKKSVTNPGGMQNARSLQYELDSCFAEMEGQTLEQAQFMLWNHQDIEEVYVMCHIGIHFRVLRYSRHATPEYEVGETTRSHPFLIPTLRSKTFKVVDSRCTDFSRDFKRWWTTVKNARSQDLGPAGARTTQSD